MIKKDVRFVWIVPSLLALAVMACSLGGGAEATATPLPRPTRKAPDAVDAPPPRGVAPGCGFGRAALNTGGHTCIEGS